MIDHKQSGFGPSSDVAGLQPFPLKAPIGSADAGLFGVAGAVGTPVGFGEPWTWVPGTYGSVVILNRDSARVAVMIGCDAEQTSETARRVVACVNALRGYSVESIEALNVELWPQRDDDSSTGLAASTGGDARSESQMGCVGLVFESDADAALARIALEMDADGVGTAGGPFDGRLIEYEVAEHPWASEEGCAPRGCAADARPGVRRRRVTHEEAAAGAR